MAPQARSQATVDRVLKAAAVVFAKHGIRGGSIHSIARRSGVSIGSIYHHFKDRDGVAVALFRQQLDSLLAAVCHGFLQAPTAKTALFALVKAYLSWVKRHPQGARLLFFAGPAELKASQDNPLDATKAQRLQPMVARVRAWIEAGWLRPIPLPLLEVVLVAPVAELARRSLCGAPELLQGDAVAQLQEALWRSVAVDPAFDGDA